MVTYVQNSGKSVKIVHKHIPYCIFPFIFQMQLIDKKEAANFSSYYNLKIFARWYRFSSNSEDYAQTSGLNSNIYVYLSVK